jgi:hypothetical protein
MVIDEILFGLNWQIHGGGKHLWQCYGDSSRYLDFEDDDTLWHVSVIFDIKTKKVFEVTGTGTLFTICNASPWRWIDPDYRYAHNAECANRNILSSHAWDDIDWVDLNNVDEVFRILSMVVLN